MTPSTTIVDALLNSICVKSEDRHVPYQFGEVVMALALDFKCLMEDVKILHDQSLKYATKEV